MASYENEYRPEDEVTLVEVAKVIRSAVRYMIRKWWLYAILFILVGGGLVLRAFLVEPTYRASVTYLVDQESGSSGVGSILGQFGIGVRTGSFNLAKITELAKSNRIMGSTLLTQVEVDGSRDYLANHVIAEYELDEVWKEKRPELEGFRFRADSVELFDEIARLAYKRTVGFVIGGEDREGLIFANYDEESGILTLSAVTTNEDISINLANIAFDHLRDYYVEQAIGKHMRTMEVVQNKVDSISAIINLKTDQLARFNDVNQNLWSQTAQLERIKLQSDLQKLQLIHGEALKNREIADFSLRTAMPSIQPVDRPISPLTPDSPSVPLSLVIAAFISVLVGSLILFLWDLNKKMNN